MSQNTEQYLARIANGEGPIPPVPTNPEEQYLAYIATGEGVLPKVPTNFKESMLAKIAENGGGGGGEAVLINKSISANGTYNASSDDADGYKKVTVNVPNSYAASDEGKVVSNGALAAQTAHAQVTQNGTIDTTLNNSVEVAVPQPSGTKNISINQNGTTTENVNDYASASITVAVPVPTLESKSVSANGTYTPESGKAWNEVEVDVPSYENRTIMLGNTTITGGSPFPDVLEVDCRVQGTSGTLTLTPIYSELGKTVIIDLQGNNVPLLTMTAGVSAENAVEKITCSKNPALEIIVMGSSQVFRHCNHLTEIRPALNFENLTSDFNRYWDNNGGASLSYVRCVANSAKINFNFSNSSLLTDDSIVSIANACNGTVAKTLTLHATPKARCNSIMGTVSSVTEDGVTYDFFTADAGGSTTLLDFITNTKGWTLA